MTKPNKLILVASGLIIAGIIAIFLNDLRYSWPAFILKMTGFCLFMYALYLQAKTKPNK